VRLKALRDDSGRHVFDFRDVSEAAQRGWRGLPTRGA
jgi:hypothetical protein